MFLKIVMYGFIRLRSRTQSGAASIAVLSGTRVVVYEKCLFRCR